MDIPLNRVEILLQNSEMGLTIQKITQLADVTEKEAKNSIKALHAMGQIEMIPTPGRWGPRYAWLAAKPVAVEPPAIPEEDLIAGGQDTITGDGSGEPLPEIPMLEGSPEDAIIKAVSDASASLPEGVRALLNSAESEPNLTEQMANYHADHYREPTRYAVAVPRRPLRIVKTRERAEALALAAVRRGAKGAEVFALTAVGRAKRDATFEARS